MSMPRSKWLTDPQHQAEFRRLWFDMSIPVEKIGAGLGVAGSTIIAWRKQLGLPSRGQISDQGLDNAPAIIIRDCLKCAAPFASQGPGHRICRPCKYGRDWTAGNNYASDYTVAA